MYETNQIPNSLLTLPSSVDVSYAVQYSYRCWHDGVCYPFWIRNNGVWCDSPTGMLCLPAFSSFADVRCVSVQTGLLEIECECIGCSLISFQTSLNCNSCCWFSVFFDIRHYMFGTLCFCFLSPIFEHACNSTVFAPKLALSSSV